MPKNKNKNISQYTREYKANVIGELDTNRLFVYGIFLNQRNRDRYGMYNAEYATVPGFFTVGSHIVQAVETEDTRIALTGVTVDVDPRMWPMIDGLEAGYTRQVVLSDSNEEVYMYTQKVTEPVPKEEELVEVAK